ncbi:hypothetical protein P7K49_022516 [Saguinus oedipus]|uniref:Uncharacterized protein n=1 Tax=Saguinus oedipus TaxID=9490 RepID=A0ABQ9UXF3_SAGOE|nr:hypothetical protein P7K49_022516 [Saguinus oedipus]
MALHLTTSRIYCPVHQGYNTFSDPIFTQRVYFSSMENNEKLKRRIPQGQKTKKEFRRSN